MPRFFVLSRCVALLSWTLVSGPVTPAAAQSLLRPVITGSVESAATAGEEAALPNSQAELIERPSGAEVLSKSRAPQELVLSIVAEDPEVRQPIALTWDGRGRLWVAENYTYADSLIEHDLRLHDRILILSDPDGDGKLDERRVFSDQLQRLTSLEIGRGGIWAMCPPHLLFIPDADGDDVPDGEPVVALTGWNADDSRHNFANGLRWGPDGWLYGRSGILATSFVGLPESDPNDRVAVNCAIWRYHPEQKKFEVVCHGTTNPWGMDWDQHGQLFFINTVIGHLWHVLPGAHYQRMYGADFNPHLYDLLPQTADHVHWDAAHETWTAQRNGVTQGTDAAGGGHAHSGLLIYQADQLPAEYRNEVFTVNLHGLRINRDHLERAGATYVARHRPDFVHIADPWFRGIELSVGPDGSIYLLDWSDIGECHENDGVHRTSGRIYRIRAQAKAENTQVPPAATPLNLDAQSDEQLAEQQFHQNEWYVRQARRILQQRAATRDLAPRAVQLWQATLTRPATAEHTHSRLRALWALHCTGHLTAPQLRALLSEGDEHVRVWAVQLLSDQVAGRQVSTRQAAVGRVWTAAEQAAARELLPSLVELAQRESSGLVWCYLASALQKFPPSERLPLAELLVSRTELASDPVFPLMAWYALEPLAGEHPEVGAKLLGRVQIPSIARWLARRIASELPQASSSIADILAQAALESRAEYRQAVLLGTADALRGRYRLTPPANWSDLHQQLSSATAHDADTVAQQALQTISLVFGDGQAMDELRKLVADKEQPLEARRQALQSLADARIAGLQELLVPWMTDRDLGDAAIRAASSVADDSTHELLLQKFSQLSEPAKYATLELLAARPQSAARLLAAVQRRALSRELITPFLLRQIQLLNRPELNQLLQEIWPELPGIAQSKLDRMEHLRASLTPDVLAAANLPAGRVLFRQQCSQCHQLFDAGQGVGPNLTGGQRQQLTYWLDNIVDPSAQVASNFRMSIVHLHDGRVLNGVILRETADTILLRTPTEERPLERDDIESIEGSQLSLMPDGLLEPLTPTQLRDLLGYLMSPSQVPEPTGQDSATGESNASGKE